MVELRYTARARRDLTEIWNHIARDNPGAADSVLLRLFRKAELARDNPQIGIARPNIGPKVRLLIEGPYILIYETRPRTTVVIAIVHGARHPDNWLG